MMQIALAQGAYTETRRPIAIGVSDMDQEGAQIQNQGLTPLMHAAQGGHLKCVKLLLRAGASLEAEDEDGLRPLHFAARSGNQEIGSLLIRAGAKRDALDDSQTSVLEMP